MDDEAERLLRARGMGWTWHVSSQPAVTFAESSQSALQHAWKMDSGGRWQLVAAGRQEFVFFIGVVQERLSLRLGKAPRLYLCLFELHWLDSESHFSFFFRSMWVFYLHVHLCTMYTPGAFGGQKMGLETVVNCHTDAGYPTQDLWKNRQCTKPLSHLFSPSVS